MIARIRVATMVLFAGSIAAPTIFAQARPSRAPRARAIAFRSGSGHLGIGVAEIDAERAKALSLKEERGVEVKSVEENSPAAKAGVKTGDVVLDYNGQRVEGVDQFIRMVSETPAGRKFTLSISRGGAIQTLSATLEPGSGHQAFDWSMGNDRMVMNLPPMPPVTVRIPDLPRTLMSWQSSTLGIESESLNSQLAEFFGVKEGVLVRSVMKDSAGEKAGLKAGDVIVKVDGSKVTSPKEISSLLRSARSRKTMSMSLVRNRKEMNVEVKLDDVSKWPSREERAVL
ncbi:MAG: PDZ domain-containing protein [Acidobacteriota bacterium]|nr:PDZ domain-containing protein [Acidobacteriota bacterium]